MEGLPNPIYCYPLQKYATTFGQGKNDRKGFVHQIQTHLIARVTNAKMRPAGVDSDIPGRASRSGPRPAGWRRTQPMEPYDSLDLPGIWNDRWNDLDTGLV